MKTILKTTPVVFMQMKIFELKLIETVALSSGLLEGKKRHTWEKVFLHSYRMFQKTISFGIYDEMILQAIFLHDIVEDSFFTRKDIENRFSPSVSFIVDALTTVDDDGKKMPKNIYFEKFLLASEKQWRILFIKLLDSIDNLETIHGLSPEKQAKFQEEKKEIFLPIFVQNISHIPFDFRDIYTKLLDEFQYLLLKYEYAK